MFAIISELDADSSIAVKVLWNRLHQACGLEEIFKLPTPHFTWFSADELNIPQAASITADIADRSSCLSSYVFGLGIFAGENPILYLPIVKSQAMFDLHAEIWRLIQPHAERVNKYYAPAHWLPHITLAIKDLTFDNLACVLQSVAFEPVELTIAIDNFTIVSQAGELSSKALRHYLFCE